MLTSLISQITCWQKGNLVFKGQYPTEQSWFHPYNPSCLELETWLKNLSLNQIS